MLLAIFNAVATPPPVLALGVLVVDDVLDCVVPLVAELEVPVVALAWDWVPALVVAVWCWVAALAVVEAAVEDCVAAAEDWRLAVVVALFCDCLAVVCPSGITNFWLM